MWLPAEDVLPSEPLQEPADAVARRGRYDGAGYSRRPAASVALAASPSAAATSPVVAPPSPPPPTEDFINQISRPLTQVLPTPPPQCRRRRQAVSTLPPRRTRRIARLPPEIDHQAAATICRRLGFTEDQGQITEEVKDKYARFFENPLSRDHMEALATLLGKQLPMELLVEQEELVV